MIFRFTLKNEFRGGSRVYEKSFFKVKQEMKSTGDARVCENLFLQSELQQKMKSARGGRRSVTVFFKVKRRSHKKNQDQVIFKENDGTDGKLE